MEKHNIQTEQVQQAENNEQAEVGKKQTKEVRNESNINIQQSDDVNDAAIRNFLSNLIANIKSTRKPFTDKNGNERFTKIDPNNVDWKKLQHAGIAPENLNMGQVMKLLDAKKTDLLTIDKIINGEKTQVQAKLSITTDPETGEFNKIKMHYKKAELNLEKYFNIEFSDDDRKQLLETGNLGRVVDVVFKEGQEPQKRFISVDFDTNEVLSKSVDSLKIGDKFMGVDLTLSETKQLKEKLLAGERVFMKDLQYGEHKVDANVQYNAAKGQFVFDLTAKHKKMIALDRIAKEMNLYNVAGDKTYRFRNAVFVEEDIVSLSQGKALFRSDLQKKDGTCYSAFVKYNFNEGKLNAISREKMEKSQGMEYKKQETPKQEQPKKSKGVRM